MLNCQLQSCWLLFCRKGVFMSQQKPRRLYAERKNTQLFCLDVAKRWVYKSKYIFVVISWIKCLQLAYCFCVGKLITCLEFCNGKMRHSLLISSFLSMFTQVLHFQWQYYLYPLVISKKIQSAGETKAAWKWTADENRSKFPIWPT